jgi:sec-independent protein translocase protein TatB
VFNLQGSEIIFLLLIALVVLGPEKLPDAIRKFGRAYAEFKKMANGFQGELKSALDEPMRELKDTADAMRNAVNFSDDPSTSPAGTATDPTLPVAPPPKREQGLNFGSANPRRTQPVDDTAADAAAGATTPAPVAPAAEAPKPGGLNFGAAARRERPARDPLAAAPVEATPAVEPAVEPPATTDEDVAG